jgi:LacI family transcriptional regulator
MPPARTTGPLRLETGTSGIMRKRVTMHDIAELVGVHVSTISRALDPKMRSRISPDVRAEIERVSKKLGFRPNAGGHLLRTNRSRMIGIIVPDIADPIYPPLIRGCEDALIERGYSAILANTDDDETRQAKIVESMLARSVDGFTLASVKFNDPLVKTIKDMPVVTMMRTTSRLMVPCVVYDESAGIRDLMNHLVALGHRRIASISGPQNVSTSRRRHEAVDHYRRDNKLPMDDELQVFSRGLFTEQEGERCAEQLLINTSDFTAIVCANDRLAIGAISALKRHGLRCPDDVSVTGYNDMPYVDRLVPALTTVRVQQYRMGQEAAKLLVEVIENPGQPRTDKVVLPVELVVRDSTRPVRADTPTRR